MNNFSQALIPFQMPAARNCSAGTLLLGQVATLIGGRRRRYAWAGRELAPMLQLTHGSSFCSTVTFLEVPPRGYRLP